jgi:hypothetical protein
LVEKGLNIPIMNHIDTLRDTYFRVGTNIFEEEKN